MYITVTLQTVSAHAAGPGGSTLLDQGYRQMYNLDFDGAHRSFDNWRRQHPKDPLGPVSDGAAYIFWRNHRLHILQSQFFVEDSAFRAMKKPVANFTVRQKFQDDLAKGQQVIRRHSQTISRRIKKQCLLPFCEWDCGSRTYIYP